MFSLKRTSVFFQRIYLKPCHGFIFVSLSVFGSFLSALHFTHNSVAKYTPKLLILCCDTALQSFGALSKSSQSAHSKDRVWMLFKALLVHTFLFGIALQFLALTFSNIYFQIWNKTMYSFFKRASIAPLTFKVIVVLASGKAQNL